MRVKFITCPRIMPPTRRARTRTSDGHSQPNMYFGAAIFRQLTTAQLQELCRPIGLSALGRRKPWRTDLKPLVKHRPPHQMINLLTDNCLPLVFPFSNARIPTHSRRSRSPKSSNWFKTPLKPQPETSPGRPLVQPQESCSHRHRLLHR